MKTLTINNYEELENLSIKTLEENATEKGTYKSYTYYFVDTKPYYDTCLFVVGNNKIIYIDEQLQYSNELTTEQAKEMMLNKMKSKIFKHRILAKGYKIMLENFEKIMQGVYTQIVKAEKRPKKS